MANTVVVGVQWGDEGKGKIVDWLAGRFDAVVRFQGGHNAGHTLVVGGETYKLSMLPSGVVRPGKLSVIGGGVVLDPWSLLQEIAGLEERGLQIGPERLAIAENVPLILPLHKELDALRENAAGAGKIGTTGRGIGPAYEDKIGRRAIRLADLADPDAVEAAIPRLARHHNALRTAYGAPPVDERALRQSLAEVAPKILPFSRPVWNLLHELEAAGKSILFEGAQGLLLDIDHGTYPFVTSSSVVPGSATAGSGIGPGSVGSVLGVSKAYATRVGAGPFPTELTDEVGLHLSKAGREFGTVTGRARRCGWFDAVLTRQACRIAGITELALTKLDVLDGLEQLKICVGYRIGGRNCDRLPTSSPLQSKVEPVYETVPGWSQNTSGARSFSALPPEAARYVRRLEELTGVEARLLSTSPVREDVIELPDG